MDDVVFDGSSSTADCYSTTATGVHSITMENSYTGTLHLQETAQWTVGAGGLSMSCGDIEQEQGQTLEVDGDATLENCSINVAAAAPAADLKIAAGGRVNITGDNTLGDTLKLTGGAVATMTDPNGGIEYENGAGINISSNSSFNWVDGNITFSNSSLGSLVNAGTFTKSTGTATQVFCALVVVNSGTLQIQQGTFNITFADDGNSFYQSAGTLDLWAGTTLSGTGDVWIAGGNLWTEGNATVATDLYMEGGYLNLNLNNQNSTATLTVSGTFTFEGTAEWDCKVDCATITADQVVATNITIGGFTTFTAQAVNGPIPGNKSWTFLQATSGRAISGAFDTMNITGWGWSVSANNDVWYLGTN